MFVRGAGWFTLGGRALMDNFDSALKFALCSFLLMEDLKVVFYCCDINGRHFNFNIQYLLKVRD